VPDNDLVPNRIRRAWKPAAELAIGGQAAELVTDECGRALAADLRESGLAPALVGLASALDSAIASGQPEPFYAAAERLRAGVDVSPLALAVLGEGERLLETGLNGYRDGLEGGAIRALVDGSLRRYCESALFGSEEMLKRMYRETGKSISELDDYKARILGNLPISELGRSIVRSPDGEVRTPARRTRSSTSAMLDEQVL
jgi:hypothetical protein